MRRALVALAFVAAALAAQDGKPASAPTTRPYAAKLLGRTVTIGLPSDWAETTDAATFALDGWERAKSWKHPKITGCAFHVFGAEGPGLTPATVVEKWIAAAGSAKVELKVEVTGRSRQMRGQDVELELDENGAASFYWMRAIAGAKDRVFVLLLEASPLDYDFLETIVDAGGPILDSFLDPKKTDPWKRDPEVTITRGKLVTRITTPTGWRSTRLSPEGSLIWMGPREWQEFILGFPQTSMRPGRSLMPSRGHDLPADKVFEMTVKAAETLRMMGRLVARQSIPGADRTEEVTVVNRARKREDTPPLWMRRRIILHGDTVVSVLAKQPLADYEALPPDAVQKQVTAVLDSIRFEDLK